MVSDDTLDHERTDDAADRSDDDEPGVFPFRWAGWGGWGVEWPYRSGADTEASHRLSSETFSEYQSCRQDFYLSRGRRV
jgi:hypothetical protein